jgi:transposase
MWTWLLEKRTQAMSQTKSGSSWLPTSRSSERTPHNATTILREVLNGLRWVVRTGSPWRYMPHDLPPWEAVYQQTQRWIRAGVFEQMVHDLRVLLRLSKQRGLRSLAQPYSTLARSALHSRERPSGRLRRAQGQEGIEGACRGRHPGTPARLAREPGQRGRPKGARETLRADTTSDPRERRASLRRSGLHRRASGPSGSLTRHQLGSGKAPRGQARLRALAEEVGGGTRFRVGIALWAIGEGLREAARDGGGASPRRVRLPLSSAGSGHP